MASIEKRTRNGRTRWYTRYRDPSGKQCTRTFDRKVDAQRHLTSVESAKQVGVYIDPSRAKVTMGEWSKRWLAGTAHLKPSTRERYEGILRAHILPRWRTTNLDNISHSAVQAWVTELSKELQPATVRKVHRVLSLILTLAVKDGRLVRNSATDINLPRVRSTEQRYLTHEQVHALARAAAAPDIPSKHRRIAERYTDQYRLIVLFLAYTGVRFGEMAALRVGRIDFLRRRLVVAESVTLVARSKCGAHPRGMSDARSHSRASSSKSSRRMSRAERRTTSFSRGSAARARYARRPFGAQPSTALRPLSAGRACILTSFGTPLRASRSLRART